MELRHLKTVAHLAGLAAIASVTSGCAYSSAMADPDPEGEARLASMLEGRIAGEPKSCIPASLNDRMKIIDRTAIVYDAGRTIYVARPENPQSLDNDDILVISRYGGQICKQDIIHTVDRSLGFTTGVVFLGDFVPYTRQGD